MLLPPDTEPEYELTPLTEKKSYTAEDGTVLAECSYALLTLHVSNQDELSERTAQQAQQTVENFNERIDKRMQDAVSFSQELGDMARNAYESGYFTLAYADEASASGVRQDRSTAYGSTPIAIPEVPIPTAIPTAISLI